MEKAICPPQLNNGLFMTAFCTTELEKLFDILHPDKNFIGFFRSVITLENAVITKHKFLSNGRPTLVSLLLLFDKIHRYQNKKEQTKLTVNIYHRRLRKNTGKYAYYYNAKY